MHGKNRLLLHVLRLLLLPLELLLELCLLEVGLRLLGGRLLWRLLRKRLRLLHRCSVMCSFLGWRTCTKKES